MSFPPAAAGGLARGLAAALLLALPLSSLHAEVRGPAGAAAPARAAPGHAAAPPPTAGSAERAPPPAAAQEVADPGPAAGDDQEGRAAGDTAAGAGRDADQEGRAAADTVPDVRRDRDALAGGGIEEPFLERLLRGMLGLSILLGGVWLFSARRHAVDWALVAKGLGFQLVFALLVLKTDWGRAFFRLVNDVFVALIGYTNEGARFLFGNLVENTVPVSGTGGVVQVGANFAFSVLPTIIFFSSLMTVLYHLGVMQAIVKGIARLMRWSLRTSGAETLSAAGNIFVGQTEAPLLVKPFVERMTASELNTVMTGGFATVAGGVMAAYVAMLSGQFPTIAGHLLAASIMAAPAGIVVSKMLMPETDEPDTKGGLEAELEQGHVNAIDAAAGGAADGLRLALNVGAMLLAFLALIALGNGTIAWAAGHVGIEPLTEEPLQKIFGWLFSPVAWVIGVPWSDAVEVGSLFGIKMVANEFVAFQSLSEILAGGGTGLARKSVVVATYALTGFANFSSIAIQIGGIGGIAPSRRQDLSKLGVRAMLGGTAATWMTATFAGVLA